MDRKVRIKFQLFIIVIALVLTFFVMYFNSKVDIRPSKDANEVELYKCVDGDTAWFKIDENIYKVRFLAIDAPESNEKIEYYGKQASSYTCKILSEADTIKLEKDDNSDEKDRYGRYLMWIFVDDILLQEDLVLNGYAEVKYVKGDYKYLDELYSAQKKAKTFNKGMWSNNE